MNQYKFYVGATPQTVTSTLNWNANGSLGSLAITDQLNSSNTQTCNYSHDDLGRIASANCGTVWNQAFGFDPFGNISKTATAGTSFLPTYSQSTNRYSSVPGCAPSYDANGFATNDCSHTYSWDSAGNPLSIDSVNLTYDALGRMVEQARGTTFTQIVYAPGGGKLALMTGQPLSKAFVSLPGGAAAVYTASGLAYYRHADWLGSSRLATTPTRTVYSDTAYGPYGEGYAVSGTADLDFTGQNQDTVSGLYDFMFREYNTNQGRWPWPDPAGIGSVSMTNPQSWNRYAYVGNMPLVATDELGLLSHWSDVAGTGRWGFLDGLRDPGGAWFYAQTQGWAIAFSPMQEGLLQYSLTIPQNWTAEFQGGMTVDFGDGIFHVYNAYRDTFHLGTPILSLLSLNDASDFKPWEMRFSVVSLLRDKNDCSAWFNTGKGSAADTMSHVPIKLGDPTPGPRAGSDADTPQGPAGPITVFPNGRFYPNSTNANPVGAVCNYSFGGCTGGYQPGSHGARMIILLHELAHKVNLIDAEKLGDTRTSDDNTQKVMQHCATSVGK